MPDTGTARKLYAIMRYAKIKSFTALDRVCKHNTRVISGENIRKEGPAPVELLEQGSGDFVTSAHALLNELGISKKSLDGKVLAVETVVTASRAWFEKATDEEEEAWLHANVEWAKQKFGRGLLSAKLHLDEEVRHIHLVSLPVVEKLDLPRGKKPKDPTKLADYERRRKEAPMKWTLSYHDVLGGPKERFSREQDAYHAAVADLGLERGEIQREDIEIEIGDELTVSALELSRGSNADGTPRPRRSMTPAEGRAVVKRLRSEAEAAKRIADEARQHAEQEQAAAAAARADAELSAQGAADHLHRAALRHDEAVAAAIQAGRERDAVVVDRAKIDIERQQLDAGRRALATAASKAEQARLALIRDRDQAAIALIHAEAERGAARSERESLSAERQAIADEKTALVVHQKRQHDEIELLARGADDANGLQLKPIDESFAMTTAAMTTGELAVYRGRWTEGAIRIGRQLALALERIRRLAADLLLREGRVVAGEADLARREAAALARDRQHQVATADLDFRRRELDAQQRDQELKSLALDQRERDVKEGEANLAAIVARAAHKLEAAVLAHAKADADLLLHSRWALALDQIDRNPEWVEITADGRIRLDPAAVAVSPPALINTLNGPTPAWAMSIISQRLDLAETLGRAEDDHQRVKYAAERLEDMIDRAGPVLTPAQQPMAIAAQKVVRQYGPRPEGSER
jgi:hypothetical protein